MTKVLFLGLLLIRPTYLIQNPHCSPYVGYLVAHPLQLAHKLHLGVVSATTEMGADHLPVTVVGAAHEEQMPNDHWRDSQNKKEHKDAQINLASGFSLSFGRFLSHQPLSLQQAASHGLGDFIRFRSTTHDLVVSSTHRRTSQARPEVTVKAKRGQL